MEKMKKIFASIMASVMLLCGGLPIPGAAAAVMEEGEKTELEAPVAGLDYVPGKVLVKLKEDAAPGKIGLRSLARSDDGISRIQTMNLPDGADVLETVRQLIEKPEVEYAEPVYIYRLTELPGDDDSDEGNNAAPLLTPIPIPGGSGGGGGAPVREETSVIEATYGWQHIDSTQLQTVTVAVIDSGIDLDHTYLAGHIVPGYNALQPNSLPEDDNGHGTHVAGIIGAKLNRTNGVQGVASGVKLMPIKAFNQAGDATSESIIRGIDYAVKNGAQIINMSFGGENYSRLIHEEVQRALDKGIVVVAASGNESNRYIGQEPGNMDPEPIRGISPVSYPAALPGVIAVGAAQRLNGQWIAADFSNSGRELAVSAPGVNVYSTYLHDTYKYASGTSQATPFVSGVAALLKAAKPELTLNHIRALILDGAVDAGAAQMDNDFGAGIVHVGNTLRALHNPRLLVEQSESSSSGVLSFQISALASDGTVSDSVYGALTLVGQQYDIKQSAWTPIAGFENRELELANGHASLTFEAPDSYDYRFYLNEGGETAFVRSNTLYVRARPAAPAFSLASGTYAGSRQVSLSTTTADAEIYYRISRPNQILEEQFQLYSSPISVSGSMTIEAFSYKNGTVSELSTGNYTITAAPSFGGGGGGFMPPAPTDKKDVRKNDNGQVTVEVEVSKDRAIKELESQSLDKLLIDARSVEPSLQGARIDIPIEVVDFANKAGKPIRMESDGITIDFPVGSIPVDEIDSRAANIRLIAARAPHSEIPQAEGQLRLLGDAWNFELTKSDRQVVQFGTSVSIQLELPSSISFEASRATVYYYNEQTQSWEHVGGKVNGRSVTFSTKHFSIYAVMERPIPKQSFRDINGHWGAADIEWMAERGIVNGIDEGVFAPEREVTRAEFAAMLSRVLGLADKGEARPFIDVAADSWYNDAVYLAYQAGIVEGTAAASFEPNKTITREQMAVMLMRAHEYQSGKKLQPDSVSPISAFGDTADMADWAKPYIHAASTLELLNGNPDGNFAPKSATTRVQAVVVLKRLVGAAEES
jgi:subtilisin family serine protease